jgi:uncharacterized Ntn-hydrolase superfamily protein
MLSRDTCWGAMVEAFDTARGTLTERLLAALDAAEREGGDARGRESARILVRQERASGVPWEDRVIDLSVVDHHDPVPELHRLVNLKWAYDRLDQALELVEQGQVSAAADEADAALALAPAEDQILFWSATIFAAAGRVEDALQAWRAATDAHPGWPEFLRRCVAAGLLPPDAATLAGGES